MNAVYLPFRMPAEDLPATLEAYAALDIRGYSVTIPHKQVRRIRSSANGRGGNRGGQHAVPGPVEPLDATNTDYEAALATLRLGMKADDLAGMKVLMLGAGGVAQAIGLGSPAPGPC